MQHATYELMQRRNERFGSEGGLKEVGRLAAEFERTRGIGMLRESEMPTGRGKNLAVSRPFALSLY